MASKARSTIAALTTGATAAAKKLEEEKKKKSAAAAKRATQTSVGKVTNAAKKTSPASTSKSETAHRQWAKAELAKAVTAQQIKLPENETLRKRAVNMLAEDYARKIVNHGYSVANKVAAQKINENFVNPSEAELSPDTVRRAGGGLHDYYQQLERYAAHDALKTKHDDPASALYDIYGRKADAMMNIEGAIDGMTQDQGKVYIRLLERYGFSAAHDYYRANEKTINARHAKNTSDFARKMADESPVGATLLGGVTAYTGAAQAPALLAEYIGGKAVDVNSPRFDSSIYDETVRNAVGEKIKSSIGGAGGEALAWLYDVGYSGVQSVATMPLGGTLAPVVMGANAYTSGLRDATQRGATGAQAQGLAAIEGVAEAFFEKIGLNRVFKLGRGELSASFVNLMKTMGVEGAEELGTEAVDLIADAAIMGNKSNFAQNIKKYQREGFSEAESGAKALVDALIQVGQAGLSGAILGGAFGGGAIGTNAINTNAIGGELSSGSIYDTASERIRMAAARLPEAERASLIAGMEANEGSAERDAAEKVIEDVLTDEDRRTLNALGKVSKRAAEAIKYGLAQEAGTPSYINARKAVEALNKNNRANYRIGRTYRESINEESKQIIAEATESEAVRRLLKKAIDGETFTPAEAESIKEAETVTEALRIERLSGTPERVTREVRTAIEGIAEERVTGINPYIIARAASKSVNGEELTEEEQAAVDSTEEGQEIFNELTADLTAGEIGALGVFDDDLKAKIIENNSIEAAQAFYRAGRRDGNDDTGAYTAARREFTDTPAEIADAAYAAGQAAAPARTGGKVTVEGAEVFAGTQKILTALAKRAKTNIRVVNDVNGAEDGMYDAKTNTITLNASNGDVRMLYVFGHETVHRIRAGSEGEYKKLEKYAFDFLKKQKNYDINKRIEEIKSEYAAEGIELDDEGAKEEIVAKSFAAAMSDKEFLKKIANEDRNLFQMLKDALERFVESLSRAIKAEAMTDEESIRFLIDTRKIAKMMDEALLEIGEAENKTKEATNKEDGKRSLKKSKENYAKKISENEYVAKENADLKAQIEKKDAEIAKLKADIKLSKTLTYGRMVDRKSVAKIARAMKKEFNSTVNTEELTDALEKYYARYYKGEIPTPEEDEAIRHRIGKKIIDAMRLDDSIRKENASFISYMKNLSVSLDAAQKEEAISVWGSYGSFARHLRGKIKIKDGAQSLNGVWDEIVRMSNGLLDADVTSGDMLFELTNLFDVKLADQPVSADERAYYQELVEEKIWDEMAKTAPVETQADKIQELKKNIAKREETFKDRLRQVWADSRKETSEEIKTKATRTKYRKEIEKAGNKIVRLLESPTRKEYVPEKLKVLALSIAELVSYDTIKYKKNNNINMVISERRDQTKKSRSWKERLANAAKALQEQQAAEKTYAIDAADNLDPEVIKTLEEFIDDGLKVRSSGGGINNMTDEQLKTFAYIVSTTANAIQNAGRMIANARFQNIKEVVEQSIAEINERVKLKERNKAYKVLMDTNGAGHFLNSTQLDAFSWFKELGPAAETMLDELYTGWKISVVRVAEAKAWFEKMSKEEGLTTKDIAEWKKKKIPVGQINGKDIELTAADIMSIYVLSKREAAKEHMDIGGVVFTNSDIAEKISVDQNDAELLKNKLTDKQIRIADRMQRYLSTTVAEWGNEATMALYGVRKFIEIFYWRIKTDANYRRDNTVEDDVKRRRTDEAGMWSTLDMGMTRSTQKHARNPILISGIFDEFTDHISDMARYSGMAGAMTDMRNWYNYIERPTVGRTDAQGLTTVTTGYGESVKAKIEQLTGKNGKRWIVQFMKNISEPGAGSTVATGLSQIQHKLTAAYKVASIGANLRVVVQQATSILRAMTEINPIYLLNPIMNKNQIKEMREHSAIAKWKSWGYFDALMGRNLGSIILGEEESIPERIKKASTWMIGAADDIAWSVMWGAAKREVQQKHPSLSGDAYWKEVEKIFDRIINNTQVVDSVFHRSQLLRDTENGFAIFAGAFMSEPTKSYNLIRRSLIDAATSGNKQKAAAVIARAGVSVFLAQLACSAAAAFIDAFRDRDDKKDWLEKYLTAFLENTTSNLNPLEQIPFLKDAYNAITGGYKVSSTMDIEGITEFANAARALAEYVNGTGSKSGYALFSNFTKAISKITGIPAGNFLRTCENIINAIAPGAISWEDPVATTNLACINITSALMDGDREKADEIIQSFSERKKKKWLEDDETRTEAQWNAKEGYVDQMIDTGMKEYLVNEEAVQAAAEARKGGDTKTYERILKELTNKGFKLEWIVGATDRILNAEEKENSNVGTSSTTAGNKYSSADIKRAVKSGNKGAFIEIEKEIGGDKAESALKSELLTEAKDGKINLEQAIKTYRKFMGEGSSSEAAFTEKVIDTLYKADRLSKAEAEQLLIDTGAAEATKQFTSEQKAYFITRQWDYEEETGENTESDYAFVKKYVKEGDKEKLKAEIDDMKAHGKMASNFVKHFEYYADEYEELIRTGKTEEAEALKENTKFALEYAGIRNAQSVVDKW